MRLRIALLLRFLNPRTMPHRRSRCPLTASMGALWRCQKDQSRLRTVGTPAGQGFRQCRYFLQTGQNKSNRETSLATRHFLGLLGPTPRCGSPGSGTGRRTRQPGPECSARRQTKPRGAEPGARRTDQRQSPVRTAPGRAPRPHPWMRRQHSSALLSARDIMHVGVHTGRLGKFLARGVPKACKPVHHYYAGLSSSRSHPKRQAGFEGLHGSAPGRHRADGPDQLHRYANRRYPLSHQALGDRHHGETLGHLITKRPLPR